MVGCCHYEGYQLGMRTETSTSTRWIAQVCCNMVVNAKPRGRLLLIRCSDGRAGLGCHSSFFVCAARVQRVAHGWGIKASETAFVTLNLNSFSVYNN